MHERQPLLQQRRKQPELRKLTEAKQQLVVLDQLQSQNATLTTKTNQLTQQNDLRFQELAALTQYSKNSHRLSEALKQLEKSTNKADRSETN